MGIAAAPHEGRRPKTVVLALAAGCMRAAGTSPRIGGTIVSRVARALVSRACLSSRTRPAVLALGRSVEQPQVASQYQIKRQAVLCSLAAESDLSSMLRRVGTDIEAKRKYDRETKAARTKLRKASGTYVRSGSHEDMARWTATKKPRRTM
eukprot:scaffold28877_cov93-Phaeocystis_antarctica.AAC.1